MRCPKCGYISFDHLEKCLKCNKDIEAVSDSLFGSTFNIQPPTFLHLQKESKEESSEQIDSFSEDALGEVDEYVDEDLEILIEDEEAGSEETLGLTDDTETGLEGSETDDQEEDREIEIDFSQFEDTDEPEVDLFDEDEEEEDEQTEQVAEQALNMDVPEELADLSDLSPPGDEIAEDEPSPEKPEESDAVELELDDLDFELGLDGLSENELPANPGISKEAVLALDEIDFSETLAESSSDTSKTPGNMDMDEDLNFDLDLGGLSIHKDI